MVIKQLVRQIKRHKILSVEWVDLVDSLAHLANLGILEVNNSINTEVSQTIDGEEHGKPLQKSEILGRAKETDTLWDQDKTEDTVRIIVEEAKVNTCLRLLSDFKSWKFDVVNNKLEISRFEFHVLF